VVRLTNQPPKLVRYSPACNGCTVASIYAHGASNKRVNGSTENARLLGHSCAVDRTPKRPILEWAYVENASKNKKSSSMQSTVPMVRL
jgi:hypothetical protein